MSQLSRRELLSKTIALSAVVHAQPASARAFASPAPPKTSLAYLGASDAAQMIRRKALSSAILLEAGLQKISEHEGRVNALITTLYEQARAEAAACDREAEAGRFRGPLHGVPFLLKDNIDTARVRTTAGSAVFDDRVPEEDAPVAARLRKAGAILLGKTNMHEFAGGSTSASSYFGPTHNPWALDRDAGGSSGGSAAAVSAGFAPFALGTDTGGSIRMPAAYCSVVGLKPSYGLVPIRGIVPLVPSLDHCGPIARTVRDAALILQSIAGYDRNDLTSFDAPLEDYLAALDKPVHNLRVGVAREPFYDHLDDEIAAAMRAAEALVQRMTGSLGDVRLPDTGAFGDLAAAEIGAFHKEYFQQQRADYQLHFRQVLKRNFDRVDETSGRACSDKVIDYVESNWRLQRLRRASEDIFRDCDAIILPTMRKMSGDLAEISQAEDHPRPANPMPRSNCAPFNILGLPAISIPCGFSKKGLPIGLMIVGPMFGEATVLALANAIESETPWHRRHPELA
ncbi:MAG: amidase [Sphingomonadales bacterium]|nr:MAG: amidase [Sphingomonadales bacterium]